MIEVEVKGRRLTETMLQGAAIFSFINILLLLGLLVVYGDSFRKIGAQFTAGFIFFAALFLVQNLLALYS